MPPFLCVVLDDLTQLVEPLLESLKEVCSVGARLVEMTQYLL